MRISLPKVARPGRSIAVRELELQRKAGTLIVLLHLADGAKLDLPMTDEAARGLGRALLSETDPLILPRGAGN